MQSKETIYSYIINVLTFAKLAKVELKLTGNTEMIDKIISTSLSELDKFEELDTLNPHQNLSLKVKCVVKNKNDEILLMQKKKETELFSFSPSLSLSFKDDMEKHLITLFGEEIAFNYEIKDLINLADLKSNGLIKEELTTPIYLLVVKISVNSSRIIKKGFIFNKEYSELNELDKFILTKGE